MTETQPIHQGRILAWRRLLRDGEGYRIHGQWSDRFGPGGITTTTVLHHDEATGEIVTRNSRYTLVGAEGDPLPDCRNGPWVVVVERSIDGKVMAAVSTTVYDPRGHDHGLASDDTRVTGVEHVSVTLAADGGYPTFTIPRCTLRPKY